MIRIILTICYILLAPLIGGLLDGLDRKISARMQRRVGPPLLQPFYDVSKLLTKRETAVTKSQNFLLISYMVLMILTGAMFFSGTDILMCFFVMSTAATFLYFAGVVTSSPYASIGAQRELLSMMIYEPAVLFACVGFYLATGSFNVADIAKSSDSAIMYLPGFFIAFVFILTIKMRKSPFDLATSHHPNQEIVKGITSDIGTKNLAIFTVTEWYENVFLMAVVSLFIVNENPISIVVALVVVLLVYFLEILIDNASARVKWQTMLKTTWVVTLFTAGVNLIILMIIK
ncbi:MULTISPECIES: NADH-quinone oxidoreductase subunit H [Lachnospira]|uniref:Ech hydrogenase subunit B n=2 Tax=Lachnospira TaxID=28050 RepID=A0A1H5V903_9FIRM|nr:MULTISPECIES: NADH-quinone oxidoreductase subunit H [Lachnospira]SDN26607.1 ech hydrogenase subunit B [Lachnospira pectinoschiza]SEF83865.1 ech hydrogenase subunit B [Lachnospira multipara]